MNAIGLLAALVMIVGCTATAPQRELEAAPSQSAPSTVAMPVATSAQSVGPAPATATPATATPAPTASPSPKPGRFVAHDIAQVVTTDLVVRSEPGLGAESEMHPFRLAAPTLLYVLGGPEFVDGYEWYWVVPEDLSYLPTPYVVGWVAAGSKEGEPWIGPANPRCPETSSTDEMPGSYVSLGALAELSGLGRLACFGGVGDVRLEGYVSGCGPLDDGGAASAVWSNRCVLDRFDCCPGVTPYAGGIRFVFDGDVVGIPPHTEGIPGIIVGHFDDRAAADCPDVSGTLNSEDARLYPYQESLDPSERRGTAEGVPPGWGRFLCRTEFVATTASFISGP